MPIFHTSAGLSNPRIGPVAKCGFATSIIAHPGGEREQGATAVSTVGSLLLLPQRAEAVRTSAPRTGGGRPLSSPDLTTPECIVRRPFESLRGTRGTSDDRGRADD